MHFNTIIQWFIKLIVIFLICCIKFTLLNSFIFISYSWFFITEQMFVIFNKQIIDTLYCIKWRIFTLMVVSLIHSLRNVLAWNIELVGDNFLSSVRLFLKLIIPSSRRKLSGCFIKRFFMKLFEYFSSLSLIFKINIQISWITLLFNDFFCWASCFISKGSS